MSASKVPCSDCPWRKDIPPGDWSAERFQNLYRTCQDDGFAVMACHKSRAEREFACAGFVVQVGFDSIGVRIQAFTGAIDANEYSADGLELFADFDEMLEANGVPLPPRNVFKQ